MSLELDHLFVFASPGAPEADRLVAYGLTEGAPNVHRGQGTANRRFPLSNAMLETIWVADEREVASAAILPTGLAARARYRENGASPIGICLRATDGHPERAAACLDTWSYRPPYLPADQQILIARTCAAEPLVLVTPAGRQERRWRDRERGPQAITGVRVTLPDERLSPALRVVEQLGIATFLIGPEHLLEVSFDGAQLRDVHDLRPDLPLVLRR